MSGLRLACSLFLYLSFVSAATRAETITVATYNVQNYCVADRMAEGVYRQAYPKPESEKAALRAVIRSLNADVLALQEMGTKEFLDELQRDLASEGLAYPHAVLLEAADADRHVAVLSRRPLSKVVKHTDLVFTYFKTSEPVKRGMLEVRFQAGLGEIALLAVHLKSRFTDRDDDPLSARRRLGEAVAIRDRIINLFPEPGKALYIVAGDCNDSPSSPPVRALMKRGEMMILARVAAVDSRGESWTHLYRKEQTYSTVDHLFVSPALSVAVVPSSGRVADIQETGAASDHRPVAVTIDTDRLAGAR